MDTISEIRPLIDALDFIKFTDRSIGNKFTEALKALELDLQEAEGGPYEPSTEAEKAFNELAVEIADALEKEDDEPIVAEVTLDPDEPEEVLDDSEDEDKDEDEDNEGDLTDDILAGEGETKPE